MKTKTLQFGIIAMLAMLPQMLSAQWNMVRFDQYNFFNKTFTATPQTVFAGGTSMTGPGSFILRSNDGGASWDSINFSAPLSTSVLYDMKFTDVDHGFAGGINNSNQVLLSTSDNGTTWNSITPDPLSTAAINSISFLNQQDGFVSSESQIYKTTDGGTSWTPYTLPLTISTISFSDIQTGFAGGTDGTNAVVMKTSNSGQTWNTILSATNQITFVNAIGKTDVINSDVVFASLQYSNVIFKTVNSGLSWDTITIPQFFSIQDYDFISATEGHALSNMGEIYGTVDGGLIWNFEYAVAGGAYGPSVFLTSLSFSGTTGYVCGSSGLIKKYTLGSTGLDESKNVSEQIVLFPNPSRKGNNISIKGIEGSCTIEIFNSLGQSVYLQELFAENNSSVQTIKTELASGIYSVNVRNGSANKTKKLIVW